MFKSFIIQEIIIIKDVFKFSYNKENIAILWFEFDSGKFKPGRRWSYSPLYGSATYENKSSFVSYQSILLSTDSMTVLSGYVTLSEKCKSDVTELRMNRKVMAF